MTTKATSKVLASGSALANLNEGTVTFTQDVSTTGSVTAASATITGSINFTGSSISDGNFNGSWNFNGGYISNMTSILVNETTPFDNSAVFEAWGKGGFVSADEGRTAYFGTETHAIAATGDVDISGGVEITGDLTVTAQPALADLTDSHVLTKNLSRELNVIGGRCEYFAAAQAGGLQTTNQFLRGNGGLAFGGTPLSGDAGIRVTYFAPCIMKSGSSFSSNSAGSGNLIDLRENHVSVFDISTPRDATAKDVAIRFGLGNFTAGGTGTGKLLALATHTGYGVLITKHPSNNTYIARLIMRTALSTGNITNATNTTPITITQSTHTLSNGDYVEITGVNGNTGANGIFQVSGVTAHTFVLDGSVGTGAYTSAGYVNKISSDSVELNPYTFYRFALKWNASTYTASLHLHTIESAASLSISGSGLTANVLMSQTGGILQIGMYSVTDTTAYLVTAISEPYIYLNS